MRFTQGEYYSYPAISYAQGWSLVYFLRETVPKNKKWNAKWGKILDTYFDDAEGGGQQGEAAHPEDGRARRRRPRDGRRPGMDDPGMDPGDERAGDGRRRTAAPGMDEPGMDEPPVEPDPESVVPKFFSRFNSSEKALKKAVDEAFKGVDMVELEKAWRESTLKVK